MKIISRMLSFVFISSMAVAQVTSINNKTNLDAALADEKLIVIDVYADWCKPCQEMAPRFLECSNNPTYESISFYKMNVETGLAGIFNVMSIPTLLFFKKGELIKRTTGSKTKLNLEQELNDFLKNNS